MTVHLYAGVGTTTAKHRRRKMLMLALTRLCRGECIIPHPHKGSQRDLPPKSNRLVSQDTGVIGSQCFPVFAMLLSMVSSFRMQAVRASFLGFPAARSRW